MPEWPMGAGCKPVGVAYGGSNPPPPTSVLLAGSYFVRQQLFSARVPTCTLVSKNLTFLVSAPRKTH